MRDAALVAIQTMKRAHPDELERAAEWRDLAEKVGIPIVENPIYAEARKARALRAAHEAIGGDE